MACGIESFAVDMRNATTNAAVSEMLSLGRKPQQWLQSGPAREVMACGGLSGQTSMCRRKRLAIVQGKV